jgi:hypothetical protein
MTWPNRALSTSGDHHGCVFVAITADDLVTEVRHGENGGRTLKHRIENREPSDRLLPAGTREPPYGRRRYGERPSSRGHAIAAIQEDDITNEQFRNRADGGVQMNAHQYGGRG